MQIGGSDQWGNIVAGIDLIKSLDKGGATATVQEGQVVEEEGKEVQAYGMTIPLLTTSNGEKFGKSAGNAVWLDEGRTGISDFYQVSPMRPSGRLLLLRGAHVHMWLLAMRSQGTVDIFERSEPDEECADTQFFIRSTDEDVGKYLRLFTLLPLERIDEIMAEHQVRRFSFLNLSNHPPLLFRHPKCRSVVSHTKELKMRDRS